MMANKSEVGTDLKDVQEYCNAIVVDHSNRKNMQNDMEKLFLMEWDEKEKLEKQKKGFKATISPDARNRLLGAVRLMISTDPQFNVPRDKNEKEAVDVSDKLEKAARIIWRAAGRKRGTPIHYDAILSGLLFGEAHYGITSTKDLVEHASKGSDAMKKRAEEAAARTPYIVDVWDPRDGYAVYDSLGMRAYYRKSQMTAEQVKERYPKAADVLGSKFKRLDQVNLNLYYDLDYSVAWLDEKKGEALINEKHNLPFIPIEASIAEGSMLFSKPEYQRQPFLYGVWKSDLYKRQNLALSVLFHLVFTLGVNPQLVYKTSTEGKELDVNYDVAGGYFTIKNDESVDQLRIKPLDPSVIQAMQVADRKAEESTIYAQALGQPVEGSHVSFSMVSLLAQAGRLPLVWPQRKMSWGIGNVMEIMLKWLKHDNRKTKAKYGGVEIELEPSEIPDDFEIDVRLDVSLPQDKLQQATIVDMITRGPDPIVSKRYGREEYLNIDNPDEIQKEIWDEQACDTLFQQFFRDQISVEQGANGKEQGNQGEQMNIKQLIQGVQSGQIDPQSLPPAVQEKIQQILKIQQGGGMENTFRNAGGNLPNGPVNRAGGA
jgi:hypothetical protein